MIISELIAQGITEGLYHPGDIQNGQAPAPMQMTMFNTVGKPPQVREQIESAAKMFAEAIVYLIETKGESEIIPRAELEQLRKDQK